MQPPPTGRQRLRQPDGHMHQRGRNNFSPSPATASAYVPSRTITRDVTVDVLHPEHVKAETVERSNPSPGAEDEALALASAIGSDDPYAALDGAGARAGGPARRANARGRAARVVRGTGLGVALVRRPADGSPSGRGCAGDPPAQPRPRSGQCWRHSTRC